MYKYTGLELVGVFLFSTMIMLLGVGFSNLFVITIVYLCASVQFGGACIESRMIIYEGQREFILTNIEFGSKYMIMEYNVFWLIFFGIVTFLSIYYTLKYFYNDSTSRIAMPTETWGWLAILLASTSYSIFKASSVCVLLFERRMLCSIESPLLMPIILLLSTWSSILAIVIKYKSIRGFLFRQ